MVFAAPPADRLESLANINTLTAIFRDMNSGQDEIIH